MFRHNRTVLLASLVAVGALCVEQHAPRAPRPPDPMPPRGRGRVLRMTEDYKEPPLNTSREQARRVKQMERAAAKAARKVDPAAVDL